MSSILVASYCKQFISDISEGGKGRYGEVIKDIKERST
jgi:hypothetical protein